MVGQQVLHCLLETLAAEPLEECNGIPSGLVRVAKPCAAIPDAEAVHLLGGMIVSDPMDMIAERLQYGGPGQSGHIGFSSLPFCAGLLP